MRYILNNGLQIYYIRFINVYTSVLRIICRTAQYTKITHNNIFAIIYLLMHVQDAPKFVISLC